MIPRLREKPLAELHEFVADLRRRLRAQRAVASAAIAPWIKATAIKASAIFSLMVVMVVR